MQILLKKKKNLILVDDSLNTIPSYVSKETFNVLVFSLHVFTIYIHRYTYKNINRYLYPFKSISHSFMENLNSIQFQISTRGPIMQTSIQKKVTIFRI